VLPFTAAQCQKVDNKNKKMAYLSHLIILRRFYSPKDGELAWIALQLLSLGFMPQFFSIGIM
jgi:hypothetical protein